MTPDPNNGSGLRREVGGGTATLLVVANMVGTGIFTTTGFIMEELGSASALLLCWFAGGVFAMCGALCYAELGSRLPRAGGEYVYLREAFGEWMGFLSGWISLIVGFSAPIAAAAIAFSVYGFKALGIPSTEPIILSAGGIPLITLSPEAGVALTIVVLLSLLHSHSLWLGSRVQNALTAFKIALVLLFIGAGFWIASPVESQTVYASGTMTSSGASFAVALIFVSFAYSGWNAAAYLGGEIKSPRRTLPLALITGTAIVMALYILINMVYVRVMSPSQITGTVDIGARAAAVVFGAGGSRFISLGIAIGLLSVLSAMILTGPRVYYAMSRDGVFFERFGRIRKSGHTPGWSIILQAGIACLMILTAAYDKLLIYIGFTLSLTAVMTVIGLFVLRRRQPDAAGIYRTAGYPFTPLVFIVGNLWIIYFSISSRLTPVILGIATIATGLIVYAGFAWSKRQGARAEGRRSDLRLHE